MAQVSPDEFILRCFGKKQKDGTWYGLCLNFDIAVEAQSRDELKVNLKEAILSYLESVRDTDDHESIPALIKRRSPFKDRAYYYWLNLLVTLNNFSDNFTFKELVPRSKLISRVGDFI